jgi:amino acid adenylation domain-containing protein
MGELRVLGGVMTHPDDPGAAATIQDLVNAALAPAALAVAASDGSLSYGELFDRASEVADALRSQGVDAGSMVGLCLPRSTALVVASLGILQAGAAYVALDPAQPELRLRGLIADSGVALVVAESDLAARLSAGAPTMPLPGVGEICRVGSGTSSRHEPGLAYVIYTSGSTGAPKGVMVEHAGLVNLAQWHGRAFSVGPADRCSQVGGVGFDAAAWEIWGCLAAGASLVVPPEALKTDPAGLRDWLIAERITVCFLPTPLAEAALALDWPAETPLRVLLTGGDRLHRRPRPGLPFVVVNNYGVTEASVVSTSAIVGAGSEGVPSIGRPIDGVDCLVVDDSLRAVASGDTGELLLGGVSVARGYLGSSELTARRFVDVPGQDGRWYRTGDLVRVRADGEVEFLSRLDEQVQIRGFRVEPGEIVAALDTHGDVAQSVVIAAGDHTDDVHLVAYLEPVGATHVDEDAIRRHVSQWLPAHMVPSAFVWIEQMPLTANGKVDREALAASRPVPVTWIGRTPVDELEGMIVEMVSTLLGLDTVGVDENFLMIGGHSLLGAQLVTRLADQFGVEMSLRDLFDHPTAAGMADLVRDQLLEQVRALDDETAASLTAGR